MRKVSYGSFIALIALSSIQVGCGLFSKKNKSGLIDPNIGFSLSGEEAKNFEDWKKAPIKSCQTDNAFEAKAPEGDQRAIDLKDLFEKSENSLVLLNADSFILFGVPYGIIGESTSELSRITQINNSNNSFGAKMTRKGSHCLVEINGEKVYETYLFASVPVVVHGQGAVADAAASEHYLTRNDQGLIRHGLLESFFDANVRKVELLAQLKTFFADWTDEDLNHFFVNGSSAGSYMRHAAELVGNDTVPAFNASFPEIPSTVTGWDVLSAATGDVDLKLTLPITRVNYGDLTNSKDQGLWQIQIGVQWKTNESGRLAYTVNSLTWQDQVSEDSQRVVDCFHARLKAFAGFRLYGEGAYSPSYSSVSGPCASFSSDSDAALFPDGKLRTHIANLFAGKSKIDAGVPYLGWDEALKGFALHALDIDVDFAKAFDPSKKSPLISTLGSYVSMVGAEALKHESLKEAKAAYAASLALPWATSGQIIEQSLIVDVMAAIANISDSFSESLGIWLQDLAKDPKSQTEQISFAAAVSEETKSATKAYLEKAEAAKVRGVVSNAKLKRVIQDRVDVAAKLPAWNGTLDALKAFRDSDFAKADEFAQMSFDRDFINFSENAVLEDWSAADFAQVDKLAQLAKKKSFCESKTSTISLINCIGEEAFSSKEGGFLASAFAGRYGELVGDFIAHHGTLEASEFVFVRQKLVDSFYNPVWKTCDNAAFASNRAALSGLVGQLLKAEFPDEFEIRNKIDSLLGTCD